MKALRRFVFDQDGATTVDWVVLTASIVAINIILIINVLEDGMSTNASWISDRAAQAVADAGR
ncbi:hypothetical protein HMH01_04080 [Halovulum dunhuangense]|uniref:Pilus assembly protein n=1 Tax=Halovulum dunhuangense TaxID=1505036 RepID=A0A849KZH3_9RHOB|nr:hypothetical protein [Halovulum dunhuangense]NNU79612.1 hypothetical protein [Halovulum dunhuangense]